MSNYSEYGVEIRKTMLEKGIKLIDLANEVGISVSYLSEILKGTRKGTKYKPKINECLGISS